MPPDSVSRKAVVTGGSSGIGRSIIHKLYDAGFETITADVNEPQDLPGHFYSADLTDSSQIESFIDEVKERIGNPSLLVCNAGKGVHEKLTEGNPDTWEEVFQVNVFSTMRLIRAFVPEMDKEEKNDVVLISSVSANHAHHYGGVYSATKAAIDQLGETLRLEVQPDVRVTVIHPGVVDTNFFNNMIHGSQTPESIGWGALQPEQVADAVLYAVSRPKGMALNDVVLRPAAQPM